VKVSVKLLKGIKLTLTAILGFVILIFVLGISYSLYKFLNEKELSNPDVSKILVSGDILRPGAPLVEKDSTRYSIQGYLAGSEKGDKEYKIKLKVLENYLYPKVDKYFVDTKEVEFALPSKDIRAQTESDLNEQRIKNGDLVLVQWDYLPSKNLVSFKDYALCLLNNGIENLFAKEKSHCYVSQSVKSWSVVSMSISSQELLRWYDSLDKGDIVNKLATTYRDGASFGFDERYYDNGSTTLVNRLMQYSDSADIYSGVLGYSTLYGKDNWDIPTLLTEKLLANDEQLTGNSIMGCRLGYESKKALENCTDCQLIKERIFNHCEMNLKLLLHPLMRNMPVIKKRQQYIDNTRASLEMVIKWITHSKSPLRIYLLHQVSKPYWY
jgi:hypothetical protein